MKKHKPLILAIIIFITTLFAIRKVSTYLYNKDRERTIAK